MMYEPKLHTGYSPATKPATSLKEIHNIEDGLEMMWAKNKKLYPYAKAKVDKKLRSNLKEIE